MPNASELTIIAKGYVASPNADTEAYVDGPTRTINGIFKRLLDGTGNDQMTTLWAEDTDDTGTANLAASGTRSVDLQGETDARGNAISLSDTVLVWVEHKAGSAASSISLQANGVNGWTNLMGTAAAMKIPPGSVRMFVDTVAGALAVAAGNRVLDIVNDDGANEAQYRIEVWGR